MRLLETETNNGYVFSEFVDDEVPPYAILSHTWDADQEVTFNDIIEDSRRKKNKVRACLHRLRSSSIKKGYDKIRFCAQQAKRDGFHYFWVDTCCIDKENSAEVQASINSMFRWYQNAAKCYVYLSDVSTAGQKGSSGCSAWQSAFVKSRWFTRGWTLQELLAPSQVDFFSKEGVHLGDRVELKQQIHDITNIPLRALSGDPLFEFSVDERLSWAVGRNTTKEEDEVYALLGIFGVNLQFKYGELYPRALRRLLEEIDNSQAVTIDQAKRMLRSTVPFRRDTDFVTRDSLGAIRRMCGEAAARVALVGLGGVGKSQIAIEYAHQVLDESPKTWVFWVHAGTQARFKEGYRNIAKKVKISNWDDPKTDIMRVVSNWLCDASNGRWVMIVDNADDASVFLHNTPASFTAYKSNSTLMEPSYSTFLPHTVNGSILVTSRSREVARMLTGSESSVIDIGPLDSQEALTLLQKKFTFAVKGHEANALCSSLDYMPLALTQAAAFINRTPRMSIPKYLREIYHDRARLLDEDLVDIRRDEGVSNSILTTWQISFDQIRERSPAAARLLSLMSLFDRHSIPEWLLRSKYGGCRNENSCFEDDVDTLTGYSFIKPSADGSSFDMHGLVQSSTKRWLEQQSELLYWKEIFVSLMDKSYPVGRSENLPVCQALLPHAQAALNNVPRDEDALEEWASLSFKLAWYVGDMGDYSEAYKLALDSYDVRRLLWGADAPLTLDSLNSLALVLNKLGRYDEAREMHQRALEAKERTLGAESSDTLCTMVNLASLYNDECKWVDAEELLTRVLHISNKLQKVPNYPLRLDALTLLATVYRDQGRWTDAAKLELQILEARKTDLGANHPVTLAVTSNLAFTYRKLGLLKEAEEMQLRIIDSCESRQGAEIDVLCYKAHLASTYRAQGRLDDAEKLELQVLETSQTKLGLNHFDTMIRMAHLASTYWKAGKLKEAQELDEQTLELRRKNLGDDHLSTLDSKANLAMTYKSQGLYDKAERLENEVLEAHMKNLGEDHPMTLNSKVHLASTYREQGRLLEAEKFNEHVLQTRTRILGPDHPDTLSSMSYLAVTYKHQKRVSKAIELMEKCSKTYERALGPDGLDMMGYKKTFERWKTESEQAAEIVSVSPTI